MGRQNQHLFTRDGLTYDCVARGARNGSTRCWRVEVAQQTYLLFAYTGSELANREARTAFEEAIVQGVARQRASARSGNSLREA